MSAGEVDRLGQLYEMLAQSRAQTQQIEEMIAVEEGAPTPMLHQRRRQVMHAVA